MTADDTNITADSTLYTADMMYIGCSIITCILYDAWDTYLESELSTYLKNIIPEI